MAGLRSRIRPVGKRGVQSGIWKMSRSSSRLPDRSRTNSRPSAGGHSQSGKVSAPHWTYTTRVAQFSRPMDVIHTTHTLAAHHPQQRGKISATTYLLKLRNTFSKLPSYFRDTYSYLNT